MAAADLNDRMFLAVLVRNELRVDAPNEPAAIPEAQNLLNRLDTVTLTRRLLDDVSTHCRWAFAGWTPIHLAAAQRAVDSLSAVITRLSTLALSNPHAAGRGRSHQHQKMILESELSIKCGKIDAARQL
ncbi:hypothetical protein, partial [Mycobacterium simiae]|uniref:hypothetical protein n=1 Tax=Mycobacterium simiae TaxID=1784 RepID=UPI001C39139B